MFAFAGPSAGDDLAGNCDAETAPYDEAGIARSDSDKAVVIAYVKQLVDGGKAAWRRLPAAVRDAVLILGPLTCPIKFSMGLPVSF